MSLPKERARKARTLVWRPPRPPPTALRRTAQHFALLRCSPAACIICISHDCGQSGLVSPEADGFCLRGKGVAGGACVAVADLNRGFYCCSLFPPLSLRFSPSFFFFSALAGVVLEERKKERQRIVFIPYVPGIRYQQDYLSCCTFFSPAKNTNSFLAIFALKLLS